MNPQPSTITTVVTIMKSLSSNHSYQISKNIIYHISIYLSFILIFLFSSIHHRHHHHHRHKLFSQKDIFRVGRNMTLNPTENPTKSHDDIRAVNHVLACDNDPSVQKWLLQSGRANILAADTQDVAFSTALMDLKTKKCAMRPQSTIAICGWSCKDGWL